MGEQASAGRGFANEVAPRVPGYGIEARLGDGAEGGVFVGIELGTGARVVLKRVESRRSAEVRRAFNVMRASGSPHLPAPRALADDDAGSTWLVTDFVPGDPLPRGPVETRRAIHEAIGVTHALRTLHAAGTHHGDVSATNVIVDADGEPTLVDLAEVGRMSTGTPGFIAPEVLSGGGGPAADRFGLACLLCWRILGQVPWPRPEALMRVRGREDVEARLLALGSGALDEGLRALMVRLLLPDPRARPQSTGDVLRKLCDLEDVLRGRATLSDPSWWLPSRWPYRGVELPRFHATDIATRLVLVVGPKGSGRARVVEEIVQAAQAAGRPARLVDPVRLGVHVGRPEAAWMEAWVAAPAALGIVGCRELGPWPANLADDLELQAQMLRAMARIAELCLVVPCSEALANALETSPQVSRVDVRPWTEAELLDAVGIAAETARASDWAHALAKVTGGWPGAVIRALRACAMARLDEASDRAIEGALASHDVQGEPLEPALARAVLELEWGVGRDVGDVPAHLHDGHAPLRFAVVAARRSLGPAGVRELACERLASSTEVTLGLAVAADRADRVTALLEGVHAIDETERATSGLLEWLANGGVDRVAPRVRVLAARWLLRRGDAGRALALVECDDPDCRIEAARALQRLGRSEDALLRLKRPEPVPSPAAAGLRWRVLVDLGRSSEALGECRSNPPEGVGVGPATAMLWGGYAALVEGERDEAERWLRRSQSALGEAGDIEASAVRARVVQLLGNLAHARGDLRAGAEAFAMAVDAFFAAQETVGALVARGSSAALAIPTVDLARGLEWGRATVRGLLAHGQHDALPEAALNLTQLLLRVGRRGEAQTLRTVVGEILRRTTSSGRTAGFVARIDADLLAAASLGRSDPEVDAVLHAYGEAADRLLERDLPLPAIDTWLRASAWARKHGRLSEAQTCWARSDEVARGAGDRHSTVGVAIEHIFITSEVGDPNELRDALARLGHATSFAALREHEELELCWGHDLALFRAFRQGSDRSFRTPLAIRLLATLEAIMKKTAPIDRVATAQNLLGDPGDGLREILQELGDIDHGARSSVSTAPTHAAPPAGSDATVDAARLDRLLRMHRRFASEDRIEILLEQVVDAVMDLTSAERGAVVVRRSNGERFEVARELVEGTDSCKFSRSVIDRVLELGEAVLSVDAAADERFDGSRSISHFNLRSVLAVPLRFRGRILGAVYVDHRLRRGNFDESDLSGVEAFADLAALAVAHAEALAEVRTQAQILQAQGRELAALLEARDAEVVELREEVRLSSLGARTPYRGIVGGSRAMQQVYRLVDRLADTTVPVVVRGESGTGKEMVARAIHTASGRASGPFIAENCGAIPETLLESILFGHVKGAFTGAHTARPGLFEAADGGTIFLDEVSEMSPVMQTKLLRVLQEGEVKRVGETHPRKIDVRVIAATHRDLEDMVRRETFRQDLYYRINVVRIDLPALRERTEDIPLLIDHFHERYRGSRPVQLSAAVRRALSAYPWPGNVRELENEVQRWIALCDGVVELEDLSPSIVATDRGVDPDDLRIRPRVERLERELIDRALDRTSGNQTRAAELLGLSRFGLQKKLRRVSGVQE